MYKQSALMLAMIIGIAGCSSTDTFEQPAPVPEVVSSVELKEQWDLDIGDGHDGNFLYLEPLYTGDRIFAASADGEVYSIEPEDGEVLWERDLDREIMAGVGGDQAFIYLVTRDAQLLALSREDGEQVWSATLPNEALAAPRSNNSMVVAQSIDGKVHAFNVADGEKLWQYDSAVPALSLRAAASPLVGADLVLASLANGRLMALSNENGQPVWQYQVGEPAGRTELERLVDVSGVPLILESAAMVVGYQGKLALVDIESGREIWSRPASSLHSPMIGNGNIFLASANGDIVALRGQDRRELWRQDQLAWRQPTQPIVLNDYLLVGDFEGYIHVLSLEDGALEGQLEYDGDGLRVPFKLISGGRLLVYGNSGEMSVFTLETLGDDK
ncbi:outer membrane protein assembly factor BamB [Marinobacter confluentis]|uniref:Outer membrane protein assembly factor BamB n=1 Tax=Marinobacter confluentis TaxID=1697557 RepID=A0A4Z1BWX9_9GAMM|nr:outer membrane protein assembly factor BamB [Marinobacter confluentis]TGN41789.1 outer membrane protein assembly factor BamB [Marinobacter confluentis]